MGTNGKSASWNNGDRTTYAQKVIIEWKKEIAHEYGLSYCDFMKEVRWSHMVFYCSTCHKDHSVSTKRIRSKDSFRSKCESVIPLECCVSI